MKKPSPRLWQSTLGRTDPNPVSSSFRGGGLPPTTVAEPLDDPFLVSALRHLGKKHADQVMQRLMGEHMDEDLAPRDRRGQGVHLPEMDCRRTPILAEFRVHRSEGNREAQKHSSFGPRDDGELPRRHLRAPEVEHPGDPAVAQGMDLIRIGFVAHRWLRLSSYSTQASQTSQQRCKTFCRALTECAEAPRPSRHDARVQLGSTSDRMASGAGVAG